MGMTETKPDEPGLTPADFGFTGKPAIQSMWDKVCDRTATVTLGNIANVRKTSISDTSPDVRAEAKLLERALRVKFEQQTGSIENSYYCTNVVGGAAAVRTVAGSYELHIVMNSDDADLVALEAECLRLVGLATDTLSGKQLKILVEALYAAVTRVLRVADLGEDSPDRKDAVAAARTEVEQAAARVGAAVQRLARFVYFQGALAGTVLTVVLIALVGIAGTQWWSGVINVPALVGASLFGALGAVVSIFQRMSKGDLVLDFSTSTRQLRYLGGLRPFVGAIFGAVAQFGLINGLLGPSVGTTFGFFALIGFGAGFSERFATDMVERAGKVIASTQAK
jgi:hypothetical protein